MAKGQKRSNRETRKPKQSTPKPAAPARSFLETASSGANATGARAGAKPGRT